MTRIDFYDLSKSSRSPMKLVCNLCQKAWDQQWLTLLLTQDSDQTQLLDRLLWTADEESFLAHDTVEQQDLNTPILVTHQAEPQGERQLLINLSSEIPIYFAQFERLIELVTEDNRDSARAHYRHYQHRGYPLQYHQL